MVVGETEITGTLNYVTDYTEFSSLAEQQKGNYLALKFTVDMVGVVTTVEVVGGTKGPVALDSDMNIVLLIKNNTQKIKVTITKDQRSASKIYSLTNLTLSPAA